MSFREQQRRELRFDEDIDRHIRNYWTQQLRSDDNTINEEITILDKTMTVFDEETWVEMRINDKYYQQITDGVCGKEGVETRITDAVISSIVEDIVETATMITRKSYDIIAQQVNDV